MTGIQMIKKWLKRRASRRDRRQDVFPLRSDEREELAKKINEDEKKDDGQDE